MQERWMPGGLRTEIHLTGADTGGAFCLLIDEPPAGWALPPHRHATEAETIHIVAGRFWMDVDGKRHELGPGDTLHVPAQTLHAGGTLGDEAGRRLLLFSPAGIEGFFVRAGVSTPDEQHDLAALLQTATEFGWRFAS